MAHDSISPRLTAGVLVVDDEAEVRSAVARILGLLGYRVSEAACGDEALDLLQDQQHDVMVVDLRMPGMDGLELIERAARVRPDLMVIVLTGHATLESAIAAVRAGAADYLLKPCKSREIGAAVARALDRRRESLRREELLDTIVAAARALQREEQPPDPAGLGVERFLRCGCVTLDREKHLAVVSVDETRSRTARVTPGEAGLLDYLMQRPERVLSCRQLARGVFGYGPSEAEARGLVRPHICRLRKKIEPDPGAPCLIRTVRGKGYLFFPMESLPS